MNSDPLHVSHGKACSLSTDVKSTSVLGPSYVQASVLKTLGGSATACFRCRFRVKILPSVQARGFRAIPDSKL